MKPAEIDVVLQAFRAWKTAAYSCCVAVNRWVADCPVCGDHRTVQIVEWGDGGRVSLSCRHRCSQDDIVAALGAAAVAGDERDAKIAELRQAVDVLRDYVALQERLIAELGAAA